MANSFPKEATIIEVGPRDGLQNEPLFVPTDIKVEFINLLSQTGLRYIESGSFVSPKAIPQLADSENVLQRIQRHAGIHYPVLVPNTIGLSRALAAGATQIAIFGSASETFSKRNINCSIAQSLIRFKEVVQQAKQQRLPIRGYISCVLGCPYEGPIKAEKVTELALTMLELGVDNLSLGDTIGIGTPAQTSQLLDTVLKHIPCEKISMHFHNTYGQALANIYASLQHGIATFDSAVAGLGGCPYARGSSGNVATEDVLYMLHGLGIHTGIDLLKVVHVSQFICQKLQRRNNSFVANALLN